MQMSAARTACSGESRAGQETALLESPHSAQWGKEDTMRLTVAVCDDERGQVKELVRLLSEWGRERGYALALKEYAGAEGFLFAYEDTPCDLLLLDIEMGRQNGMALAKELRAKGDMLPIVFVTGYSDYMNDGYEVEALHYLLKPVSREKLFAVLDRFVSRRAAKGDMVVSGEGGVSHLAPEDILYCEAVGKKTHVHMRGGAVLVCDEGIGGFGKKLGEEFVSCHRSYLVNLRHVRSIGRREVAMDGGGRVPLSRRLREGVNGRFVRYYAGEGESFL